MKKNLILMMLILLLGMLAACAPDREEVKEPAEGEGTDVTEEPKPEKLVIWEDIDKSKDWLPAAITSFEKEYGIKVEFKELNMADKIRDQLRLDGPGGTAPDVVTLPHDQIGQVVTEGLIQEVIVED